MGSILVFPGLDSSNFSAIEDEEREIFIFSRLDKSHFKASGSFGWLVGDYTTSIYVLSLTCKFPWSTSGYPSPSSHYSLICPSWSLRAVWLRSVTISVLNLALSFETVMGSCACAFGKRNLTCETYYTIWSIFELQKTLIGFENRSKSIIVVKIQFMYLNLSRRWKFSLSRITTKLRGVVYLNCPGGTRG